jgi:hypothetical protein
MPPRARVLGAVAAGTASIAIAMLTGWAIAATGRRFEPVRVAAPLFGVCVAAALVAARRAGRPPSTVHFRPNRRWLWAVPAAALTVVLAVQVVAATRYRPADSYYTELFAVTTGAGITVVVHCVERSTMDYRYEELAAGTIVASARFRLAPGQRQGFPLTDPGGRRAEIRLYVGDSTDPYRRLIL